jgi:hypothetical protein
MSNQIKFSAIAAAVGLAFSGSVLANSVGAPASIGAGASAVKTGIVRAVIGTTSSTASVCGTNPATIYDNNATDITSSTALPGGSIFRIVCGTNDMSYDTSGGSWKSFAAVSATILANAQNTSLSANPVSYVSTTGTASAFTITSFKVGSTTYTFNNPVSYVYGNGKVPAVVGTDTVDFGMADAETSLFANGVNEPLVDTGLGSTGATGTLNQSNTINTSAQMTLAALAPKNGEYTGFPTNALGITFGIAVSSSLYHVLQVAQGIGGTCLDVPGYTNQACAPSIPKADVKALLSGSTAASLLTAYAPIEFARRDQGSGTNAATMAYFLNQGCSIATGTTEGTSLTPQFVTGTNDGTGNITIGAGTNYFVTYQISTGNVLNRLIGKNGWGVSTDNVIGYVSTENDSSGKLANASGSAALYGTSASFVKLDGVYPSAENGAAGLYDFNSTEVLHCNKLAGTLGSTICTALKGDFNAFTTGGGLININNGTTQYGNNGNICSGWQRVL